MRRYKDFVGEIMEAARVRSPVLYHSTDQWEEILTSGNLQGMHWTEESDEDAEINQKALGFTGPREKVYSGWSSFARTLDNSYNKNVIMGGGGLQVSFAFDGKALAQNFKIIPIDYLEAVRRFKDGPKPSERSKAGAEAEERLFYRPFKPIGFKIRPYLVAVHIMVEDPEYVEFMADWMKDRVVNNEIEGLDKLAKFANEYPEVPMYVYSKQADYLAARWGEAEQMNPHLWNEDGDDDDEV